jgi:XTP/dITP diphosphohydrolase
MSHHTPARPTVLVATRNVGKLRELGALFSRLGVQLVDLPTAGIAESADEDELETHDTFELNALAKARYFHARSGLPTVADDSGLAVDALGGEPGVRSKRFAGAIGSAKEIDRANNAKLQLALRGVADRRARFVCAAAFVDADGEWVTRGEALGRIVDEPRGAGGFGYDPYFVSDDLGMTFAEAGIAAKERVSHRGRAFRALLAQLDTIWGGRRAVDGRGRAG